MIHLPVQLFTIYKGVYFLYFKGELRYVGRSLNILVRLSTHYIAKDTLVTLDNIDSVSYIPMDNLQDMIELETACLRYGTFILNRTAGRATPTGDDILLLEEHNLIDLLT